MISGEKFLYNGLLEKYDNLTNAFKNNDFENIVRKLKDYLLEVFPAREKKGIKKENNRHFLALKKVYNLFKHDCDMDLLLNTHKPIYKKTYPYSYPYRYGNSGIYWSDFTDVFNSSKYYREGCDEKDRCIKLCNKVLKGNEVKDFIPDLHNATIQLFNL